ncbi:MAG: type II secretion system protein [Patescibacteria group bacterium]
MKLKRGFSLIELLVVIAIIGILASIVLLVLTNIRYKAKNAVIKQEVDELAKLVELEYVESGSYANLQKDFIIPSEGDCDLPELSGGFGGVYRSQVIALCEKIVSIAPELSFNEAQFLMANEENDPYKYSIMATLWTTSSIPDYYCAGISGKYESSNGDFPFGHEDDALGCYWNP